MDPVSGLVAALVLIALVNRLPNLVSDLVHAARGEESPTRAARAKRLAEAGVEPGRGGAARQYMAGVWRDAWLDAEKARVAKRDQRRAEAAANPGGPSRWQQRRAEWADRAATAAAAVTDRWRGAETLDPTGHVHGTSPTASPGAGASADTGTTGAYATPTPPSPSPGTDAQPDRPPTRVTATLGPPAPAGQHTAPPSPAPQSTTGSEGATTMSTAVATSGVTGAASAAAAARALRDAMNDATATYTAQLVRIRAGIQALGEAALNDVQLHGRAVPVQHLSDAAGSLDSLRVQAATSAANVSGWLGNAAKAFTVVAS